MIVDLKPEDIAILRAIHLSSGIDYKFPDLAHPLFVNKIASWRDGKLIAAGLHKIAYETFVLVDPKATPQGKWAALKELNDQLAIRAYGQGLDETHAALPPIGFAKRMRQLDWSPDREGWQLWSRETNAVSGK